MTYFNDKKAGGPKWIAGDDEHEEALAESGISVEAAWRIPGRPVRWLVENVIPDEAVTVIAGDAGAGKTFFACQLAADAARVSQCRVVLATSSYEAPELLRWRLDQADADTRRIAFATLTPPKGIRDRRLAPTDEEIDERMAVLYHTLLGAGDPTSGILPVEAGKAEGERQKAEDEGQGAECNRQSAKANAPSRATRPHPGPLPEGEGDNCPLPALPRAAELLVIDDVDGWFGKPGQCVSAAVLARVIGRLNELARSLKVAIVVLVRAQMSVEGRITSRQLSRLSQSASVVWMVVRDREQGTGQREDGDSQKSKVQSPKSGGEGREYSSPHAPREGNHAESPSTVYRLPSTSRDPQSPNPASQPRAYSQSDRRWLLPVKNNLAPDVATFGRAFELFDGQIRWHGDDRAPSLAEATLPSVHNSDRRRLRHAAAAWLEEALAAGPLPSKELYRQGVENGFSQGTLKRAATELGLFPHKTGFDGGWEMCWTPPPQVRGRGTTARRAGAGFKIFGGDDGEGQRERGSEWEGKEEGRRQKAKVDAGGAAAGHPPRGETGQGDMETRGQGEAVAEMNASCASSEELKTTTGAGRPHPGPLPEGEGEVASCASSEELKTTTGAGRPHPGPLPEGEGEDASCASSEELKTTTGVDRPHPGPVPEGEGEDASCASSEELKTTTGAGRPHPGPGYPLAGAEGDGEDARCASSEKGGDSAMPANGETGGDTTRPHPSPGYPLAGAEGEGANASCASSQEDQCKMQNAKCKTQNDASGSSCDSEDYAVIADALHEAFLEKAC